MLDPRNSLPLLGLICAGCLTSCAPVHLDVRPQRQTLDVRLDPDSQVLEATSTTELEVVEGAGKPRRRSKVELELHPDLVVTSVEAVGATLSKHRILPPEGREDGGVEPATLRVVLENPSSALRLDVAYRGRLWQDVAAGEVAGQVHNFGVQAHVGKEGIYLEPGGYWYPRVRPVAGVDPDELLTDYELRTDPVEGFELVAGLEAVVEGPSRAEGRLHWKSPFPLDGLVLLGGPLERHSKAFGDIRLHAVVAPGKQAVADDILAASAEYLDRYEPLIGPYPFREFTVLEAFFSSGFAFPTCTQIAGSQLSEHRQYRRHGYLDHRIFRWRNPKVRNPGWGRFQLIFPSLILKNS